MSTNKRGALTQPLQKLVLSYLSLISTIGRLFIMGISPEIISLCKTATGAAITGYLLIGCTWPPVSMITVGLRDGYWQPGDMDILLVTKAMRVRMLHCEFKWETPGKM